MLTPYSVFIVDDDAPMRDSLLMLLRGEGLRARAFAGAADFLNALPDDRYACVVTDVRMPGMEGPELIRRLRSLRGDAWPIIVITGHADVPLAVQTMKAGACDFLEKPCKDQVLLDAVSRAVARSVDESRNAASANTAQSALARLTAREREVALLMAEGKASKVIARELGISDKTVQVHRHNTMEKLGLHSAAEVARLLMAGGQI